MAPSERSRAIVPQPRDLELLRGLFDSRLMTLAHAAALYFDGSREAAKKRMQKLKAAGLIGERSRKAYQPSILFLTHEGFRLIEERGLLHEVPKLRWTTIEKRLQVSDLTLRHELEVLDVKAAITNALRKEPSFDLPEFSTWPLLSQFRACPGSGPEVVVKPDGFLRIHERDGDENFEHVFFLELDRSTETLDTLARRALCYLDYYQTGGLSERFGRPRSEYKDFPFRVLMIFKTAERRNNIAEQLLINHPPILTQVWLSTVEEVTKDPLGAIWIRPQDYRRATAGTTYAPSSSNTRAAYRRSSSREQHVEVHVEKHQLWLPTLAQNEVKQ